VKRRVQAIEAFWQQKMAEVDPEWLFWLGGMALALALFLLLFGEVYPAVLTGGMLCSTRLWHFGPGIDGIAAGQASSWSSGYSAEGTRSPVRSCCSYCVP
jgi:hypothetical protein